MRFFIIVFFIIFTNLCHAVEVSAVNDFDINKYSGTWYEIARLPNKFEKDCIIPIEAKYSLALNKNLEINIINKCNKKNNESSVANGVGTFIESSTTGKFKVSFLSKWLSWLPIGKGEYYILYTDYKTVSLVSSPDHKYLWILSRSENLNKDVLKNLISIAKSRDFEIDNLIYNYTETK